MAFPIPEVRDLEFDLESDVPRHWHGDRPSVSAFFDNLSLFFPSGERFFIASVKAHRAAVTDRELREHVRAFYAQEGIHSREHVRYNAMLRAKGYPAALMEKRVARLLRLVVRLTSPRMQLAATCALEHFTALMAHALLRDPRMMAGAHPVMAALWRWHAAEENEHKAVAFDVFSAAGGTYTERVVAMVGATVIFWVKVLEHQSRLMHVDGTLWSTEQWWQLVKFLYFEPGMLRGMLGPYLAYYRPSFHPWQLDNQELLDVWKSQLDDVYGRAM